MEVRPFVPGDDSHLGAGVPPWLREHPGVELRDVMLIKENATTLSDRFRQLCYWRQVVNAKSN
ncbi:MAG: hypothetical protein ACRDY1_13910 [Acidimicrobiales bacterium]